MGFFSEIGNFFGKFVEKFKEVGKRILETIGEVGRKVLEKIPEVLEKVTRIVDAVAKGEYGEAIKEVKGLFENVGAILSEVTENLGKIIVEAINFVADTTFETFKEVFDAVMQIGEIIVNAIDEVFKGNIDISELIPVVTNLMAAVACLVQGNLPGFGIYFARGFASAATLRDQYPQLAECKLDGTVQLKPEFESMDHDQIAMLTTEDVGISMDQSMKDELDSFKQRVSAYWDRFKVPVDEPKLVK